MKYLEEAKSIWKSFVPKSGQSDTVQGELLRSVEKLRDEAIRNGNGNWDKGFVILLSFISKKLDDQDVFSMDTRIEINKILERLSDFESPYLEDDYYDFLGDCVVEYFQHYGSQPYSHNKELWR
ncbi:MAG: hypothetical protein ABIK92_16405 [Pseudomonadota bacterium]